MTRGKARGVALGVGVLALIGLQLARRVPAVPSAPRVLTGEVGTPSLSQKASTRDALAVQASAPQTLSAPSEPEARVVSAKVHLLNEILSSRNDNDPRLDSEFRGLTAALKAALAEKYRALPRESFNERGTLVLLIGRELASAEDAQFLRAVMEEAPCHSLRDCGARAPASQDQVAHGDESDAVTRAYPQWMAVRMLERARDSGAWEKLPSGARAEILKGVRRLAAARGEGLDPGLVHRAQALLQEDAS